MSDHPAEQLVSRLDQIREDLDLLQASVVPDPDAASYRNDARSDDTSEQSWLPLGVEQGIRSDEASSRTSFAELRDEDEELQKKSITVAGTSRNSNSQPETTTLDEEGEPRSSRSSSEEHGGSDEELSTDVERWLAKSADYGPLDFLYEMFSHLYVVSRLALLFARLT